MILSTLKWMSTVLALAALVTAGCSGADQPARDLEPVTLRFGLPYQAAEMRDSLTAAFERYRQEHAHVTIDVVTVYGRSEAVDVYLGLVDPDPRPGGGGGGGALDLSPFAASGGECLDEERLFPLLVDAFRWDGGLYGVPAGVEVPLMYYNRDLFDAEGVAYPWAGWTWQDFLDVALQLTTPEPGGEGGYWGFVNRPPDSYVFVLQNGGVMLDDPVRPTRAVFDDPRVPEAIQWYADLALVHGVMPRPSELRRASLDDGTAFATGKAAMWIGLVEDAGGQANVIPWRFEWGVVPLPRGEVEAAWMFQLGYFVAADTAYPREAWELLCNLSEYGVLWVPPLRAVAESDEFSLLVGEEVAGVALATLGSDVLVPLPPGLYAPVGDQRFVTLWMAYSNAIRDVVDGVITPERMMERLEDLFGGG